MRQSVTYYDWARKLEQGYYDVKVKRERKRKIDKEALKQAVAEKPDEFLKEYARQFNCTATAVFYALKKLKIPLKKDVHLRGEIRREASSIESETEAGAGEEASVCG